MDFVFVLEDDPIYLRQITDALKNINEQLEIRSFPNLAKLSTMIKSIMAHGPQALAKDDKNPVRVVLVIAQLEALGMDRLDLLEKTRNFFTRRGVCTDEEPTRFVLTAFDEENLKIDSLKRPILANVLLKPFDKLILEQHLQMAMPQVKASRQVLVNQKTSATVELLKSVHVSAMSELGFESESSQALDVGAVGKYYGADFATDKHRSVLARLVSCQKVSSDQFKLKFRFFALDPKQTSNLRKMVRQKGTAEIEEILPEFEKAVPPESLKKQIFIIVEPRDSDAENLAGTLRRKVQGAEVLHFRTKQECLSDFETSMPVGILSSPTPELSIDNKLNISGCTPEEATLFGEPLRAGNCNRFLSKEDAQLLGLWLMGSKSELILKVSWMGTTAALKFNREGDKIRLLELQGAERDSFQRSSRKIAGRVGAVFVSESELSGEGLAAWLTVAKAIEGDQGFRPPAYVVSQRELSDDEEKSFAEHFDDIFFHPLDRIYLLQRFLFDVQGVKILEDPVVVHRKKIPMVIRAASPIVIDEISEALVTFNYYRTLELSSFREFILWQPNELAAPEISAIVHSCSESDDKDSSRIEMTFFGVRDDQLKAVRLWIRNNYIAQKEKG